ncbi:MAG: hypothetical protein ACOZHQ_09505 [Thermodesulfobacteriota bacterium]
MEAWITQNPTFASALVLGMAWILGRGLKLAWPHFWRATSNEGLVTQADCHACDARHTADLAQGNDLFQLLLEGQALQTQALIALCQQDDGCRRLLTDLDQHLKRLASRRVDR